MARRRTAGLRPAQEPLPPSRRAGLRPAHPGLRPRRTTRHHRPPGANHRDPCATPLVHPARRRPMGPAHPQPAPHHLPVQGPSLLLDSRRHRPAPASVELPPNRCQRPRAWPGSSAFPMTTRQCNCSSQAPIPTGRMPDSLSRSPRPQRRVAAQRREQFFRVLDMLAGGEAVGPEDRPGTTPALQALRWEEADEDQ